MNNFPTKEEFLEELAKTSKDDQDNFLSEFYGEWCRANDIYDIMSDYTGEALGQDERDYIKEVGAEGLWKDMFLDFKIWFDEQTRRNVPKEIVDKYMTDNEKKIKKFIKDTEILESI